MSETWTLGTVATRKHAARHAVSLLAVLALAAMASSRAGAQTTPATPSHASSPSASGTNEPASTTAQAPTSPGTTTPATTPPRPAASAQPASGNPAAHDVLYPGDVVRLKIWREPDLSGDFQVDDRGMAVFPKIGPVHVTEIAPDSLKKMLVTTYSTYLKDPSIEVTMLRRVTVLGAVKNPGLYPVDPTMSIADVLALAGGADPNGNQDKLELIRNGKRQPVQFTAHTPVSETPIRSGDEIFLPERSWISRNGYIVGAMIGALVVVSTTLITHK